MSENKVEFKTRTAIRKNGSIGIPRFARDRMGLERGTPVTMFKIGNSIIIEPEYFTCPCCRHHASHIDYNLNVCDECLVVLEKFRAENPKKTISELMEMLYVERSIDSHIE